MTQPQVQITSTENHRRGKYVTEVCARISMPSNADSKLSNALFQLLQGSYEYGQNSEGYSCYISSNVLGRNTFVVWLHRADRKPNSVTKEQLLGRVYSEFPCLHADLVDCVQVAKERLACLERSKDIVSEANHVGSHIAKTAFKKAKTECNFAERLQALKDEVTAAAAINATEMMKLDDTFVYSDSDKKVDPEAINLIESRFGDFITRDKDYLVGQSVFGSAAVIPDNETAVAILAAGLDTQDS